MKARRIVPDRRARASLSIPIRFAVVSSVHRTLCQGFPGNPGRFLILRVAAVPSLNRSATIEKEAPFS